MFFSIFEAKKDPIGDEPKKPFTLMRWRWAILFWLLGWFLGYLGHTTTDGYFALLFTVHAFISAIFGMFIIAIMLDSNKKMEW